TADALTIAYSNSGAPLWTNRLGGPAGSGDAIAVDRSGNVFVTGISGNGTNSDYLTVAYSNQGMPLWTNRYNGPGNSNSLEDRATAIAVDSAGNVFVTGWSAGTDSDDFVTIKYSSSVRVHLTIEPDG